MPCPSTRIHRLLPPCTALCPCRETGATPRQCERPSTARAMASCSQSRSMHSTMITLDLPKRRARPTNSSTDREISVAVSGGTCYNRTDRRAADWRCARYGDNMFRRDGGGSHEKGSAFTVVCISFGWGCARGSPGRFRRPGPESGGGRQVVGGGSDPYGYAWPDEPDDHEPGDHEPGRSAIRDESHVADSPAEQPE